MCGRFNLLENPRALADYFGIPPADVPDLKPRYNVAPTQLIPVVGLKPGGAARGLAFMRWGLVPHWTEGAKPTPLINARSETAATSPAFRDPFRRWRCLVPASGFYEWARVGSKKQPYHFRRPGGRPLAFAALYDRWQSTSGPILTCCVLTTKANDVVKPLHDRMPVILAPDDFPLWLDTRNDAESVQPLLRPWPAEDMEAVAVSPLVNSPKNDGPECLTPATAG